MRILLDTCAVIDLTTDPDSLDKEVVALFNDPDNRIYILFYRTQGLELIEY